MMMKCCRRMIVLLVFAIVSGCGGEKKDVRLVKGVVTYQDAPLAGATITFIPQDAEGVMATGLTESDGSYRLTSFGSKTKGSGAKIGTYLVSIVKREEPPTTSQDAEAVRKGETTWEEIRKNQASEENMAKARQTGPPKPLPPPVTLIPLKYASGETSGLSATVENKSPNILDFRLTD